MLGFCGVVMYVCAPHFLKVIVMFWSASYLRILRTDVFDVV